jgi:hypothetical protein
MRRALLPLAIGCGLVAVIAVVLLLWGWDWTWFAIANGALGALLLVLFRGSVSGEDERRPPGPARVSAARWAGPMDPDTLAAQERALHPDPEIDAEARAEDLSTGFSFLWTAVPPAVATVVAIVFYL